MRQPVAPTASSTPTALYRDLDEEVVLLRSDGQRLDALLDAYGDHLVQVTARVDRALAVVGRRCGVER